MTPSTCPTPRTSLLVTHASTPAHPLSLTSSLRYLSLGCLLVSALLTLPATTVAQNPFAEGVRKTDPLTPEQELASFKLPPGFEVSLVAAEPNIFKPMNLAFDHRGRLWVSSSTEYPYAAPVDEGGRDTINILEDTDGDGVFETIKTFADGLNIPIGLYPVQNGCIAYSIPNIWLFEDTDGDDVCDRRTILYGPMGYERDTHGMNNGFTRGFDGWLYACHGFNNDTTVAGRDGHEIHMQSGNTYRMRLDGERVEQYTWGQVNPFGMTQDDWGNLFTADCHSKPVYQLIHGGYYPSFGKPDDGLGFVPPIMDHLHGSTAIAGVAILSDDRFPEAYRNHLISGNVMTSRINHNRLQSIGASHRAIELPDLMETSDPWFRPVDIQLGPDGAIYVADFYNRIIGHYEVPLTHPGRDRTSGRIWRIRYVGTDDAPATRPTGFASLEGLSDDALIARLTDANTTARLLTLNYLLDRHDSQLPQATLKTLADRLANSPSQQQRVAALWALVRGGGDAKAAVLQAAGDSSPLVRAHAMRAIAFDAQLPAPIVGLARQGLTDPDPRVRFYACDATGEHPDQSMIADLCAALAATPQEDFLGTQAIRIALKHQLLGQDDWPSEVAELPRQAKAELQSIALAVRTEAAAVFLMDQFRDSNAEPNSELTSQVRHIARYAPPAQLTELASLVPKRFPTQLAFQVDIFEAIYQGLRQRGEDPQDTLADWGTDLFDRLIVSGKDSSGWYNSSVPGTQSPNPWTLETRKSADGVDDQPFLTTLASGEQTTGRLRSPAFVAPKKLAFFVAGHCGHPNQPFAPKNFLRLINAETEEVLIEQTPPRNDVAQRFEWDLSQWEGERVRVEALDGDSTGAFAWLSIGRFEPALIKIPKLAPRDRNQRLQQAAMIAAGLKLQSARQELADLAAQDGTDAATRTAAAEASLAIAPNIRLSALTPILATTSDSQWRTRYAAALLEPKEEASATLLADTLPSLTAAQQQQVAQRMVASNSGAGLFVDLIDQGKLSARLLANQQILEQCRNNVDSNHETLLDNWIKQLPPAGAEVAETITARRDWYTAASPDLEKGKAAFTKHCAACHQIAGQGAVVGPQLDGIGNRGMERLLEDMLDPNRNVDVAFRTTLVQTDDGGSLTGLLKEETDTTVTLVDSQGKEQTIDADTIEVMLGSNLSLMPETLVKDLPQEEFIDLLGFLLDQTAAPPEGH